MNESHSLQEDRNHSAPVFRSALLSLAMLWLAFPPVGWFWLAWLAPVPMLRLVFYSDLGRRAYRKLFLAGLLYWLATFYFIPIPHPLLWGCWLAVSLYMACYTPLLVGVVRTMLRETRLPALLVVPIAWTGIEYFRSHFATGMPMVCLSHSQYRVPILIQVADLSGAYTLTFTIVMFATSLTLISLTWGRHESTADSVASLAFKSNHPAWIGVAGLLLSLGLTLGYGLIRLSQFESGKSDEQGIDVALIQTNRDVVFAPAATEESLRERVNETVSLTHSEVLEGPPCDLVVWPESSLVPWLDYLSDEGSFTVEEAQAGLRDYYYAAMSSDTAFAPVPLLAGTLTKDPDRDASFNSAVLLNEGKVTQRYYKRHLVMFGEYVPLADQIPAIQMLSPMRRNLDVGIEPIAIKIKEVILTPSICFESAVPHVIRRQILWHEQAGTEIDAMVNITNDGWFFGTSCLDFHLACNVFRAVEMRKQHLVCANTGLSANIAASGKLLATGERRVAQTIRCRAVKSDGQKSIYRQYGDLLPMVFQYVVGLFAAFGWYRARKAAQPN